METEAEIFDVAISFLARDEGLALQLSDLVAPTHSVFIFSKRQEEVAGTDGTESFRDIFLNRSKIKVILHRDGWGSSRWTSVEERAIRDYAFENQGRDIVLIKLDQSEAPNWFHHTSIYYDFQIYGAEQIAGVLKARAQEAGAKPKVENALTKAKRISELLSFQQKREQLINSYEGADAAKGEVKLLYSLLDQLCSDIKRDNENLPILFRSNGYEFGMTTRGRGAKTLWLYYSPYAMNSIAKAYLMVRTFNGSLILPGENGYIIEKAVNISDSRYEPDFSRSEEWGWRDSQKKFMRSRDFADAIVRQFLALMPEQT